LTSPLSAVFVHEVNIYSKRMPSDTQTGGKKSMSNAIF